VKMKLKRVGIASPVQNRPPRFVYVVMREGVISCLPIRAFYTPKAADKFVRRGTDYIVKLRVGQGEVFGQ
jgi:hypothetical protein